MTNDRAARMAWFKAVILPHEAALRRQLRREGAEHDDVDDLVAEALARAYQVEEWARIEQGCSYLFRIARNLVLDAARRNKVVSIHALSELDLLSIADERVSVESVAIAHEELRRLQKAVERMPPRPREVFLLRRLEGLRTDEVAVRLSLSVSTVEKHFTRAMVLITEAMAEHSPVSGQLRERSWQSARKIQ